MGAEQSSSRFQAGDQGAPNTSVTRKTCYYEVLDIERTATEDEIKKAYRRKALELHPDRNYGDVENATKLFAEVQAANEVLSDPQERAWYDSHREAILRNDDSVQDEHYEQNIRLTGASDIVKLMAKFNASVPFTDASSGFYGSLAILFETLAEEEALAIELEGSEPVEYPEFGKSSSNYEEVVRPFYTVWIGFGTRKSYSWKDQYRLSDAPDRRTRRAMEKENKRLRDEGIREFNDAVRSLVAFVRKRDPRYLPNTQTEAERQRILRNAATAQAARSRAANKAKIDAHVIPDWAQARDDEDLAHFSNSEESEESEVEHIECVVCNKIFKSEKQYEAHEKSKKHVKAVQQLKRQMQKENKYLNLDKDVGKGTLSALSTPPIESEETAEESGQDDGNAKALVVGKLTSTETDEDDELVEEVPSLKTELVSNAEVAEEDFSEPDENDEYAPREHIENRILGHRPGSSIKDHTSLDEIEKITTTTATTSIADDSDSLPKPKLGKAKAKRAKRAARQEGEKQEGGEFQCVACSDSFASKTKLFNHIKEYGHAAPISKVGKGGKGKKRGQAL